MADHRQASSAFIVEEHVELSFAELCRACGAEASLLETLVEEGLLPHAGGSPDDWRFEGSALPRALTALRLVRDLQLSADAAVLVVDLLAEIAALKMRLQRAGLG
jgi:chaperone modulatory protein CbpM